MEQRSSTRQASENCGRGISTKGTIYMVSAWGKVRQPERAIEIALAPFHEIARRYGLRLETLFAHRPMVKNTKGRLEKAKYCVPNAAGPAVRPLLRSELWAPPSYDNLGLRDNEELYVGMVAGRFIFVPANQPGFFVDTVNAIGVHRARYAAHALQTKDALTTT